MPRLKNRTGIIPLFLLIAVGIVFLSGGAYIVRKEFVAKGKSGKATLDEAKIKKQIESPKSLPSPTPEPTPKLAPTVFTYKPQETTKTSNETATEPVFSINPPSGWGQTSFGNSKAAFSSPDEDEEPAEKPLIMTMPANIQIYVEVLTNYDTVKNQGYSENQILDQAAASLKTQFIGPYKPKYLKDERVNFAGQQAHFIEAVVTNQYGAFEHILLYSLIKNKHAVSISGHALDSAWATRTSSIKASLNTFQFK